MRIAIANDHRGHQLKEKIVALLHSMNHEVANLGTDSTESVDYPDFAALVAEQISRGDAERGILICGTGVGMCIAANKYPGVRAAPCGDEVTAELSRRHNNLNVLCLSGDMLSPRTAERIVETWLTTEFEAGRHERRLDKIKRLEQDRG